MLHLIMPTAWIGRFLLAALVQTLHVPKGGRNGGERQSSRTPAQYSLCLPIGELSGGWPPRQNISDTVISFVLSLNEAREQNF